VGDAGLNSITNNETSNQPDNTVILQSPLGGTKVKNGATVTLTVSTGPGSITIPTVASESQAQAEKELRAAGLRVSSVVQEASPTVTAGNVTRTAPDGGTSVTRGESVILYVSSGLSVPDVVGDQLAVAQDALNQFTVRVEQQTSTTQSAGTVISQSPAAGQPAGKANTVTLVVAQAPTTVSVPNVLGDAPGAAVSTLNAANLNVKEIEKPVALIGEIGTVIKQNPPGSATVKKGAVVTITIGTAEPVNTACHHGHDHLVDSVVSPLRPESDPTRWSLSATPLGVSSYR
jgi:serine/threonine-protein kinase